MLIYVFEMFIIFLCNVCIFSILKITYLYYQIYLQLGKKGYVQIQTNMGNINVEIYCDCIPRASWNFISLCLKGYYDNVNFHRLVPGFMLQGNNRSLFNFFYFYLVHIFFY